MPVRVRTSVSNMQENWGNQTIFWIQSKLVMRERGGERKVKFNGTKVLTRGIYKFSRLILKSKGSISSSPK